MGNLQLLLFFSPSNNRANWYLSQRHTHYISSPFADTNRQHINLQRDNYIQPVLMDKD